MNGATNVVNAALVALIILLLGLRVLLWYVRKADRWG